MAEEIKKTKILYLITKSNWGGAQRYVFDLATSLPKEAYETSVALGGNGRLKDKLDSEKIPVFNIDSLERDISVLKEIKAFLNIYKIIKSQNPDIVHLNSSKAGGLGSMAVFLINSLSKITKNPRRVKTVFTAHGWAFKEKRKIFYKKIIEYSSWITIKLCDKTITVSEDDKDRIESFMLIQNKVVVIHNGIGPINFKERQEARKIISEKMARNIDENTIVVGTIAELHKNKGIDYAIRAINLLKQTGKFKNLIYVVIGSGEEKNNLELVIKNENLSENVFLVGQYDDASSLLKAFDLFILPSLKEGLPYVILEAGQAKLPIISTSVGGVPEIIEDMKTGILIREKRPKELADSITFLLEHPQKITDFATRIAENTLINFPLEKMVKSTTNLYQEINKN